jgi:hypothetical protein
MDGPTEISERNRCRLILLLEPYLSEWVLVHGLPVELLSISMVAASPGRPHRFAEVSPSQRQYSATKTKGVTISTAIFRNEDQTPFFM